MKCLCIKDGYMLSGKHFCINKIVYNYKIEKLANDNYYYIESEISKNHGMPSVFFDNYFILNGFDMNDFKDEDFEI